MLDCHKGRNRDLQGLAVAMTKLWERSAVAKIAIKRGVHNTCNDRMAEELKVRSLKCSFFLFLSLLYIFSLGKMTKEPSV